MGFEAREQAASAGITRWTDARFTAGVAGLTGSRGTQLDEILRVNRDPDAPAVSPQRVGTERGTWAQAKEIEFYVDFETVSDVNDDFWSLPRRGRQAMIFMIGCGHAEGGEWSFESFIADELQPESEALIIEEWLTHMEAVRQRIAPSVAAPLVFHWSPAESSGLTNGLKSARSRHPESTRHCVNPNWFDCINLVVRP